MSGVLDGIHEVRANSAKMRNALDRQLAVFNARETPDHVIVRGGVDDCIGYPELYHHP